MLSIAVCTHNRAQQLEVLLKNFRAWTDLILSEIEILVVDNASTDSTAELVRQYATGFPLRYMHEPQLGLSHARNCALDNFKGSGIWFLDDDTVVSTECVNAYLDALDSMPQVAYFGGPIRVDWQDRKPSWLQGNDLVLLNGLFGVHDLGADDRVYQESTLGPYGANFLLRRDLINQVGQFNIALGVSGQAIGRGEETEYFQRAQAQGFRGHYIADAAVGHRFQLERINLPYLWRYGKEKGRADVLLRGQTFNTWRRAALHQLGLGLVQLSKGRRDRFFQCWINMGIARGRFLASSNENNEK